MANGQNSDADFDNFLLAVRSNVPLAGFVTPALLQHQVHVIVMAGVPLPRVALARHHFYNPEDPVQEWPSMLAFRDESEAGDYASQSEAIDVKEMSVKDLMKLTFNASRGTCGVMFRIGENDIHLDAEQVQSFDFYATLGGITMIVDESQLDLEKVGDPILTSEQLKAFDQLFADSAFIDRYSIWRANVDGLDTTAIEAVFKKGITQEQAVPEHQRLLGLCQAISSDVTLVAVPFRPAKEISGR